MIYICGINSARDIKNDICDTFIPYLSEDRVIKLRELKYSKDKKRCILSEILLKYMLYLYCGISLNQIQYKYNMYGKPFLKYYSDIYFSISHSGDWIMCAICDRPIGIDVEGGVSEVMEIAKRFYTSEEYEYIEHQLQVNQYDSFYKIWTLKESYVKCVGKGLSIPLNSFSFVCSHDEIKMYKKGMLNDNYLFKTKKIDNKYHTSVCVEKGKSTTDIQVVSVNELIIWKEACFKELMKGKTYNMSSLSEMK